MSSSFDVRRAGPDDADTLATLNAVVQELHVSLRPDVFVPADRAEVAEWFRAILARDSAAAWIARDEGTPVGYVLALREERPATPFSRPRTWWEVDQIAVVEGARRKGVARGLIAQVVEEARGSGVGRVELAAWEFNGVARGVFEREGFVVKMVRYEKSVE